METSEGIWLKLSLSMLKGVNCCAGRSECAGWEGLPEVVTGDGGDVVGLGGVGDTVVV